MEETSTLTQKDAALELLPPKGDPNVGRKVFQILEEILQYKSDQGLQDKWHRSYELCKGAHWKNKNKKVSLTTANMVGAHRQRTVAMLTDNHPTFNVKQAGNIPDDILMELLQYAAAHWWQDTEQQDAYETSVLNGETNGIVFEKIRFDPEAEYGLGEVVTDEVDPVSFGWYPVKAKTPQKADANLHYWPMSLREARRRWPDMAGQIVADDDWIAKLGDSRKDVGSPISKASGGFLSSIAGVVKNLINNADNNKGENDEVLVVECWVKDRTRVTNKDGSTEDLYPGGIRTVWTCNGGEVVLEDGRNASINWDFWGDDLTLASMTYLFDKFPFNSCVSIKDTVSPWGQTDIEHLENIQMTMNKVMSQISMMNDKMAKVNIINPQNSGVSNNQFSNAYGVISPTNHIVAEAIRYMEPPNLPPSMMEVYKLYQEMFFRISGAFDLEQAETTGSNVVAYKAIATLLERVATLLRGKIRNYHRLIRNRGRMYLSCAQNWYVDKRWISFEHQGEKVSQPITGKDLIFPGKLEVVAGSTMPVSQVQQREEALALFDKGVIDGEEVLKKMEWSDIKGVLARMKRGPVGIAMDRLGQMGLPPDLVEFFTEIGVMDQKEFERAFEKGEIPPLQSLLFPPEDNGQPGTDPSVDAEVRLKDAQAQKIFQEIAKLQQEIANLQVEASVKEAGTEFDREKLAIERAKTVNDIQRSQKEEDRQDIKTVHDIDRAERSEARSDQAEARMDKDEDRKDQKLASELKTAEAQQKAQGPYREKGLKSNNQK